MLSQGKVRGTLFSLEKEGWRMLGCPLPRLKGHPLKAALCRFGGRGGIGRVHVTERELSFQTRKTFLPVLILRAAS